MSGFSKVLNAAQHRGLNSVGNVFEFANTQSLALARALLSAREPHHRADEHIQCVKCHQDTEAMRLNGWKKCLICFKCHSRVVQPITSFKKKKTCFHFSHVYNELLKMDASTKPRGLGERLLWHRLLDSDLNGFLCWKQRTKCLIWSSATQHVWSHSVSVIYISQAQSSCTSIMYRDCIGTALLLNVARVLALQKSAVEL